MAKSKLQIYTEYTRMHQAWTEVRNVRQAGLPEPPNADEVEATLKRWQEVLWQKSQGK